MRTTINLSDDIVKETESLYNAKIYTLDKHFKQIPAVDLYYS